MFNNYFNQPNNIINNPMFTKAVQMAQGKTPDQLKQIALEMCEQKGMSQKEREDFFSRFGMKL